MAGWIYWMHCRVFKTEIPICEFLRDIFQKLTPFKVTIFTKYHLEELWDHRRFVEGLNLNLQKLLP